MDHFELLQRLAVALAIGLLIGIERGWVARAEAEGERTLGLRTLALTGLLGGALGACAILIPQGAVVLALGFAAFALIIAYFRHREMVHDKTFGATTVLAALLAFALGALAVVGDPVAAAAAGVATAGLLALKPALHGWLRRLTWEELRAGLLLLAMSLILLPMLPDRGYGPFAALNPRELWLMAILIAAVSSAGYIAMKWVGGQHGVALSGLAGGLVSSTAVTLSFSQLAKEHPERRPVLMAGALLAGATMMVRVLLVAGSLNVGLLRWLTLPLIFATLATVAVAAWSLFVHKDEGLERPLNLSNPFELGSVLKFTLFLAVIMVAAKAMTAWAGGGGAYALAAVSGIADVDALTLSMARLGGTELAAETAAGAILIAAAVNTLSKAVMGWVAGGAGPGRTLTLAAALALAAGAAGFLLSHYWDPFSAIRALPVPA